MGIHDEAGEGVVEELASLALPARMPTGRTPVEVRVEFTQWPPYHRVVEVSGGDLGEL